MRLTVTGVILSIIMSVVPLASAQTPAGGEAFFKTELQAEDNALLVTLPAPAEDGVLLRMIHAVRLKAGLQSGRAGPWMGL